MLKTSKLLTVSVTIYLLSFIFLLLHFTSSSAGTFFLSIFALINPITSLLVIVSISLIYYKKILKVSTVFFKTLFIGVIVTILNLILSWLFMVIITLVRNDSNYETGSILVYLIGPVITLIVLTIITSIIFSVVKKIKNKGLSSNIA